MSQSTGGLWIICTHTNSGMRITVFHRVILLTEFYYSIKPNCFENYKHKIGSFGQFLCPYLLILGTFIFYNAINMEDETSNMK